MPDLLLHPQEKDHLNPVTQTRHYGTKQRSSIDRNGRNGMRTLLISEIFPPRLGGSSTWFWEMYRRLDTEKYQVAAGTHPDQTEVDRQAELAIHRVPLTLSDWGLRSRAGRQGYRAALAALFPLVKELDIQCLHTGRCLPEGVMAYWMYLRRGLPYLCYVHGEDIGTAATSRELKFLIRRVFGGAKRLIANSRNTQAMLVGDWQVPEEKVVVLPPGVDSHYYHPPSEEQRIQLREELGWSSRKVILTVGRLQRRKGHDMVIRSLPAIKASVSDVLYVIAGGGEERESLEQLAKELKVEHHVQFLGEIPPQQLLNCYQACDVFVLANREIDGDIEGFGMVLVEAQSCGRPVIAGDSGGTRETMQIDETGLLLPCETPEALQTHLPELLNNPERCTAMGQAGRAWVESKFDWSAVAQRAEEIFAV